MPDRTANWSLTTLQGKVIRIGAKVIGHACCTIFQMAKVTLPRDLFRRIPELIDRLWSKPVARC